MKIAIDIKEAGANKAGKGYFAFHLVINLLMLDKENEYVLYTKHKIPAFEQFKNATQVAFHSGGLLWHTKVLKDVKKRGVDIYFSPTSYITPSLMPKSIKTIITVHDLVAFIFPKHNKKAIILEKVFLKRALKKNPHVVTVSKNTQQDLQRFFDYPKDQTTVINCASSSEFKPIPRKNLTSFAKETELPEKFFLAVGTLEPRKNYETLIEAFAKFHKNNPDYELIIVGKPGWDYKKIYAQIENFQLKNYIHTLGYISTESLVSLYNLATALVFPTLYEGFGIPPLEAMQCGCPVICSNTSSLPEVVGDSALLIDPTKPEEIALALTKITDQKTAFQFREKGLLQAKKFSWKNSAKKLLNLLTKAA